MEITTRIIKSGHNFAFGVPKALLDCKVISRDKKYVITVKELEEDALFGILSRSRTLSHTLNKYENPAISG